MVEVFNRRLSPVAKMPWLWGGATKEKYSHDELYKMGRIIELFHLLFLVFSFVGYMFC